jgi:hypothetical protein
MQNYGETRHFMSILRKNHVDKSKRQSNQQDLHLVVIKNKILLASYSEERSFLR